VRRLLLLSSSVMASTPEFLPECKIMRLQLD
jgi:hypothetical protein